MTSSTRTGPSQTTVRPPHRAAPGCTLQPALTRVAKPLGLATPLSRQSTCELHNRWEQHVKSVPFDRVARVGKDVVEDSISGINRVAALATDENIGPTATGEGVVTPGPPLMVTSMVWPSSRGALTSTRSRPWCADGHIFDVVWSYRPQNRCI